MSETITLLTRRASLAPATADHEARTVEVIWSTGASVRRRDMAGEYIERLSLDPEAVDLSRLRGASVLDAHRQSAVRDVLGSVREAAVDGKRGTALIQFSARPEVEPIWQDVLTGILRHVSVGYSVEDWAETTDTGARVLTAVRWTPHEISLVPTPADPGAKIRMETTMTDTATAETSELPEVITRAQINAEIRSIGRIAGLDQAWVDSQIDAGADANAARRAAFDALGQPRCACDPHRAGPRRCGREPRRSGCVPGTWAKRSMLGSIRATSYRSPRGAMLMPRPSIWRASCSRSGALHRRRCRRPPLSPAPFTPQRLSDHPR